MLGWDNVCLLRGRLVAVHVYCSKDKPLGHFDTVLESKKKSRYVYENWSKMRQVFIIKSIKFLVNDRFLVISTFVDSHFVQ